MPGRSFGSVTGRERDKPAADPWAAPARRANGRAVQTPPGSDREKGKVTRSRTRAGDQRPQRAFSGVLLPRPVSLKGYSDQAGIEPSLARP